MTRPLAVVTGAGSGIGAAMSWCGGQCFGNGARMGPGKILCGWSSGLFLESDCVG
jgi:hypothetical protein